MAVDLQRPGLNEKLECYTPRAVACTGNGVYRWFRATSKAGWGAHRSPPSRA